MITFRQLQVLAEAARCGSFRRCGEKLGLSQVSVSEQIRSLEARLGVTLFLRKPGGSPVLTQHGREALLRAEQILGIVADLERAMNPSAGRRRLKVAIHSFIMRDFSPALHGFEAAHPSIAVEIDTGVYSQDEILRRITDRSTDMAFFFSLPGQAPPSSRYLRDEPLAIFVSKSHPLADARIVTASDLGKHRAIRLTDANPLGELVLSALTDIGVKHQDVALVSDEFGLIMGSVQRGLGYVCLFEASAEMCRQMGLVKLNLERVLPSLRANVVMRPVLELDPAMGEFVRMLQATLDGGPSKSG